MDLVVCPSASSKWELLSGSLNKVARQVRAQPGRAEMLCYSVTTCLFVGTVPPRGSYTTYLLPPTTIHRSIIWLLYTVLGHHFNLARSNFQGLLTVPVATEPVKILL